MRFLLALLMVVGLSVGAAAQQTYPLPTIDINKLPVPPTGSTYLTNSGSVQGDWIPVNRNGITYKVLAGQGGACSGTQFVKSISPQGIAVCSPISSVPISLGTSAAATNPSVAGDPTTGFYSSSAGDVSISLSNVTVLDFPVNDSTTGGSILLGSYAMKGLPASANYLNTAVGYQSIGGIAGNSLTTAATNNTAIGAYVLGSLTSGNSNTGIGFNCLHNTTTGSSNDCFGWNSLASNTTGSTNTAFGNESLENEQTLTGETAYGDGTLQNVQSGIAGDVAVGVSALVGLGTGGQNTAIGFYSQSNATNVQNNTSIGAVSLRLNTTGTAMTAVGYGACYTCSNNWNTAVGNTALYNTANAQLNTALGNEAGYSNTTGSQNLFLGDLVGSTTTSTGSNNILIGTDANTDTPTSSTHNYLNIANVIEAINIGTQGQGSVGISSTSPRAVLDISQNTGAVILPVGTTGTRPATGVNGMIRYNSTTTAAIEGYIGNAWLPLTTGGATATIDLGTSASANNPQKVGDATTGLFSSATSTIAIATGSVEAMRVESNGHVDIGTTTSGTASTFTVAGPGVFSGGTPDPGDGAGIATRVGYNQGAFWGFVQAGQPGVSPHPLSIQPSGCTAGVGLLVGVGGAAQSCLDVNGGVAIGTSVAGATAAPLNGMIVVGSVGIGSSSPTTKLDVNGDIAMETGTAGAMLCLTSAHLLGHCTGSASCLTTCTCTCAAN
jgi:hypothetical protein